MKFLPRLPGGKSPGVGTSTDSPADAIARALDSAGLRAASHSGVLATIDRALAAAGLQRRALHAGPDAVAVDDPPLLRDPAPDRYAPGARGRFMHARHSGPHGSRDYRLYIPAGHDPVGSPRPLVMMLHGCTQTPEDFAVGTRMNALADRHGFLVAYPQQVGTANHAKCWNWFRPEDQRGDSGEPAILAGILQQVARDHHVDARRIFVAGLSAGAAMAVILGRTRPDLVRAIGVHSGLPYASAYDVPSAFATMQGRSAPAGSGGTPDVPMIVFHGDEDRTVVPANADALVAAATRAGDRIDVERGHAPDGRAFTRETHIDASGASRLERWTVHGAGHAWSGGDPAGSYTDRSGPDASSAMVDFFLAMP